MYNVEKYIGECLESVLQQTFQNFEVIVVDDCSTDSSCEIVESYAPKFNGRLKLSKTEKNSGGGGYVPRNIGLTLASGEYVWFVDADDFILLNALETLYNAAKEYDAEVVYTASFYDLKTSDDIYLCHDGERTKLLKEGLDDKTKLSINDQQGNLRRLMVERNGNLRGPWTKFIRRDFLIKNKIFFPSQMRTSGDFIWAINLYCHIKNFLRLPNVPLYFYRRNIKSVTLLERAPSEQVAYLISVFVDFMKHLNALKDENEVLAENPDYCFAALRSHFEWFLTRTNKARGALSSEDIYAILCREFAKDSSISSTVPFLFGFIDTKKKFGESNLQTIKRLEKEVAQLKISSGPAVSVIIPMYNAEKYIAECLDSLLNQTFQNFEVIVVDDCSTDNSFAIVESYAPKFNGRLKLTQTETNSGGGGVPRNKGLLISCGEYIQFLDSDDMLMKTALAEMYTLAKDFDVDVVYCERYYISDDDGSNLKIKFQQEGKLVNKPTFEKEDLKERVQKIINQRFSGMICNKFVRRNLIAENKIFIPDTKTSEDNIWTQGLIFYAKKILRVPNAVYIYRQSAGSSQRLKRTPQQTINFWLNPVLLGLKALDDLMSRHEFFIANPSCHYALLKNFIDFRYDRTFPFARNLDDDVVYSTIKSEFGDKLGEYDVLIPALCTALYDIKKPVSNEDKLRDFFYYLMSNTLPQHFTARVDIKLHTTTGDFQILSLSDDNAEVKQPGWFQQGGIGYQIQSEVGKLELVTKAASDGQLSFNLKGISVFNPNDKAKRIPHWIGYTKFAINEQTIFDKLTPTWHDKPYKYNMNVKADEEIKIQVEWLPHKNDLETPKEITPPQPAPNLETPKEITPPQPAPKEDIFLEDMVFDVDKKSTAESEVQLTTTTTSREQSVEKSTPTIFSDSHYFDAVIGIKLMSKGKLKIFSVSDDDAKITKPKWFQKEGVGYIINSCVGKLKFVAKPSIDGKIMLTLKGMSVLDPNDSNKHIPYWVDYTLLKINGRTILSMLTSTWCDKPYKYTMNVKAKEEITVEVEWLPNR